MLAQQLKGFPNKLALEGHTDANPYSWERELWELGTLYRSFQRDTLTEQNGLPPDQISEVRGYADRRLRNPKDPLDPSNRRISLIVQYLPQENEEEGAPPQHGKEPEKASEKPSAGHPRTVEPVHK